MSGGRRRSGGGGRAPRVSPARLVAAEVLLAVRESDAYANLLLPTRIARAGLSEADAGLATELTYGTLRMSGYYDRIIAIAADRPVDRIDPAVLDVLRLGTHQLLATRVPTHAAVNESVDLVRAMGAPAASGFVNGVLRGISRVSADAWAARVREAADGPDDALAALSSHPAWVVRALRKALAHEHRADELDDLLAADNAAPAVNYAVLGGADAPGPATLGERDRFSPIGFTATGGDPTRALEGHDGRVRVQDEGSQLAALALTRARPVRAGERWLDLCAGPGGKTAVLAAEARGGGATLEANEVVPARAQLVRRALEGVDEGVEVHERDGRAFGEDRAGAFDRILLDAPCTGLGALRRRPEARWRKSPEDVSALTTLQTELLDSAIGALAPGGLLAYVTCSPHTAETRSIVRQALRRHDDVERADVHAVLGDVALHPLDLTGEPGEAQLWPHRHGCDAMFIALLAKREPAASVGSQA
ncbi:methyltransferase [Agromyces rhizosphaerae]|uniref:Methyltransferase n=1 Tax=Agromyces rhizosphaerae TaxID=88374 RepID=A0A9W6FQR7_9MICO|nr:transcription antitermination factor NusB [Agromyces rhizosphaerae]GLI28815.1 methyltransferase [Agromyces rhizosphaerae]